MDVENGFFSDTDDDEWNTPVKAITTATSAHLKCSPARNSTSDKSTENDVNGANRFLTSFEGFECQEKLIPSANSKNVSRRLCEETQQSSQGGCLSLYQFGVDNMVARFNTAIWWPGSILLPEMIEQPLCLENKSIGFVCGHTNG